ncbi:hypothetical protein C2S53_003430 [Perilla frutescens var. hirtella]|uniref:Phytocyanin domain-containing protein n=1 Tax=Perilla frutescens var. hirtella TaxID=608512 RepID=A0AAD4JKM2_PERFH|nr:hypothetical protein C2S53_003430 [Perilla frutescens var. hirtella]
MCFSFMYMFLYSLVILLLFLLSESAKVVMDGVSEWGISQVQMGDSVLFQLKVHYSLYIFQNKKAFSVCNFTQATILTGPNSTSYTWHTSSPGSFYFSLNNGSDKACLEGQKLAVKVSMPQPQDHGTSSKLPLYAAPSQISGRFVVSSPAYPWPYQPRELAPPSPSLSISLPSNSPVAPHQEGTPFISSNPAVPLPTGEVDSATIVPLPTSCSQHSKQVEGFVAVQRALSCIIFLMMMVI